MQDGLSRLTVRRMQSCLATLLLCACLGVPLLGACPAGAAPPDQPLPAAESLGSPPVPCFGYGSSDNICPEEGFQDPAPPEYMAATYYGTLEIENHIVHVGQDVVMDANEDNKGEPAWPNDVEVPIVSGCKDATESGGVRTPAETTCVWKAEGASEYPPSEAASGWRGGWEVFEIGFCGFFGCAPSGDYYYVVGNEVAISGYVLDSAGKPASGVSVAIQGAGGGVAAAVDPETGFYNALLPEGSYSVSVEREGPEAYSFGAGKVTSCSGNAEGPYCNLTLHKETGVASFQLPLEVSDVEKKQGLLEGGETIHIYGAGFTQASAVEFTPKGGGSSIAAKSFTVDSDSEITAVTPNVTASLGKGKKTLATDVRVTNNGQTSPLNPPGDEYAFGKVHTLTIKVTEGAEKPASGVKFKITGGSEPKEGTTNEGGEISEELEEGSYSVASVPLGAALPEEASLNPDCHQSNVSCNVELTQDRTVHFQTCVVPKPDGSPLPANTPNPIPGAQTIGNLEAVGCWTPQSDGSFTSTKPVRLDGIDVNPDNGTTITLHSNATVSSNGSASIGAGGLFSLPVGKVELNFQAAEIQAADLGSGNPTFGIPTSIKGVPFSLSTGSTLQTLAPPWQSSVGQTTLNLDLQLPSTLNATGWNMLQGTFLNGKASVPSIGGTIALTVTNREGLVAPQVCGKFTGGEFKLWNLEVNTSWINQATLCYDFKAQQWTLTGLFQLPKTLKHLNRVNVSIGWREGWNWNNGSIQVDGLNVQLADGVFLQRLGASFHRDFTSVPPSNTNFAISAGLSFGPQINNETAEALVKAYPALNGAELMSLNGEGLLQVWSSPAYYKLTGDILLLRNTPLQAELAGGFVDYYTSGRFDLGGELRLQLPFVHWGVDGKMEGFLDTQRNLVQLTGTDTVTGPWGTKAEAQALLNNTGLVVCFSKNGTYSAGGVWNMVKNEVSTFAPGTCEIGKYTISAPEPPSTTPSGAKLSRVRSAGRVLHLPGHLAGTTIAVRGAGAAPLVKLSGPGLSIATPPGSGDLSSKRALIVKNEGEHTTYITLWSPAGGRWSLSPEQGSAPIISAKAALPAPRAKVHARVSGAVCRRTLSYTAQIPTGESVALYAQNGGERAYLGKARGHGRVHFSPEVAKTGKGEILALETHGSLPRSLRTVATFHVVGLSRPERVGRLSLKGRKLSWAAPCGAYSYAVVVRQGKHVTHLKSTGLQVMLPKLKGRYTVSVSAVSATGATGRAREQTFGAGKSGR
jgi:hypothetical protein